MSFISVVIPAYNEEETLGSVVDLVRETMDKSNFQYEIIVVDDGSEDRTAEVALRKKVRVLHHAYNRGGGAAIKTGIHNAKGDIVVITDADGTYPVQDIPKLVQSIGEYDMVIGARQRDHGPYKILRIAAKSFIRWLACFLTNTKIPDLNSGLRAFKKDAAVKFFNILPDGFSWVSTITVAMLSNGYNVKYVPIDYYERKGGKSHFHPIKDTWAYIVLVFRTIMYFNPLKVFLPTSGLLLLMGLIKFTYDFIKYGTLRKGTIVVVIIAILIAATGLLADLIVAENKARYAKF